jgi:hypothetical protein
MALLLSIVTFSTVHDGFHLSFPDPQLIYESLTILNSFQMFHGRSLQSINPAAYRFPQTSNMDILVPRSGISSLHASSGISLDGVLPPPIQTTAISTISAARMV